MQKHKTWLQGIMHAYIEMQHLNHISDTFSGELSIIWEKKKEKSKLKIYIKSNLKICVTF